MTEASEGQGNAVSLDDSFLEDYGFEDGSVVVDGKNEIVQFTKSPSPTVSPSRDTEECIGANLCLNNSFESEERLNSPVILSAQTKGFNDQVENDVGECLSVSEKLPAESMLIFETTVNGNKQESPLENLSGAEAEVNSSDTHDLVEEKPSPVTSNKIHTESDCQEYPVQTCLTESVLTNKEPNKETEDGIEEKSSETSNFIEPAGLNERRVNLMKDNGTGERQHSPLKSSFPESTELVENELKNMEQIRIGEDHQEQENGESIPQIMLAKDLNDMSRRYNDLNGQKERLSESWQKLSKENKSKTENTQIEKVSSGAKSEVQDIIKNDNIELDYSSSFDERLKDENGYTLEQGDFYSGCGHDNHSFVEEQRLSVQFENDDQMSLSKPILVEQSELAYDMSGANEVEGNDSRSLKLGSSPDAAHLEPLSVDNEQLIGSSVQHKARDEYCDGESEVCWPNEPQQVDQTVSIVDEGVDLCGQNPRSVENGNGGNRPHQHPQVDQTVSAIGEDVNVCGQNPKSTEDNDIHINNYCETVVMESSTNITDKKPSKSYLEEAKRSEQVCQQDFKEKIVGRNPDIVTSNEEKASMEASEDVDCNEKLVKDTSTSSHTSEGCFGSERIVNGQQGSFDGIKTVEEGTKGSTTKDLKSPARNAAKEALIDQRIIEIRKRNQERLQRVKEIEEDKANSGTFGKSLLIVEDNSQGNLPKAASSQSKNISISTSNESDASGKDTESRSIQTLNNGRNTNCSRESGITRGRGRGRGRGRARSKERGKNPDFALRGHAGQGLVSRDEIRAKTREEERRKNVLSYEAELKELSRYEDARIEATSMEKMEEQVRKERELASRDTRKERHSFHVREMGRNRTFPKFKNQELDQHIHMTGKERQVYDEWKSERDRIEKERLKRHKEASGKWKRDWDRDKVWNENTEQWVKPGNEMKTKPYYEDNMD